jgi:hypothetical protein
VAFAFFGTSLADQDTEVNKCVAGFAQGAAGQDSVKSASVSTWERSIRIQRFFSRFAVTGYRFFAVLPE